jgi:hypothetical protein
MSEQSEPREQAEANAEQEELELKDLAAQTEEADQVRGGGTTKPASKGAFEVTDFGFGVDNTAISSS